MFLFNFIIYLYSSCFGNPELSVPISTEQETKITTNGFASFPAIHGDRIVRTGNPYDIVNYNIYMYDFSTKKETQ
ncbi:hypothetical protein [Methanosarcina sp.]|uniref:hypothetical protein n=1 Tax=Methanosarcina sp. TaxID=2213 RepID=UPI003C71AA41